MEKTFEIKLVKPGIWQGVVDTALAGLPPRVKAAAQSILRTALNRHIGITPQLAAGLAPLIIDSYAVRRGTGAWDEVLKRLQQEVSASRFSFAIMPDTVPLYSVIRLALPIVEEASQRIGLCYLLCQDQIENDVTPEEYQRYVEQMDSEIKQMAKSKEDFFQVFWQDRALTLASMSRRGGLGEPTVIPDSNFSSFLQEEPRRPNKGAERWPEGPSWAAGAARSVAKTLPQASAGILPEIDPYTLGLLLRLKPGLSQVPPLASHYRRLTDPLLHRESGFLKEGGVSGIQMTRRIDDMEDILLSEFVNPPAVLADRLINNGFLALRRQTRREQLRDVLIAGLMPVQVQPKTSVDFIKACWFDFLRRFGTMLAQSGRKRSEFRWLEGNSIGQVRSCQYLLQEAPELETYLKDHQEMSYRKEFLISLGWLPRYLDTRCAYEPVPQYAQRPGCSPAAAGVGNVVGGAAAGGAAANRDLESAKHWAFSVWRSQKENRQWLLYEPDSPHSVAGKESPLDTDGFAVIHLMLFLPAEERRKEKGVSVGGRLGSLCSGFGLGNIPGRDVSVTWVPGQIGALREWAFDSRGKGDSLLFAREKSTGKLNTHQIAGRIEEAWRNQLIKEMRCE